jgi:hypothetical protein
MSYADVPAVTAILRALYGRSAYRDSGGWDERACKALLVNAVRSHGRAHQGGTLALVHETDGTVDGFIIGLLDRTYGFLSSLTATDLLFVCQPGAPAHAAMRLLYRFVAWAKSIEQVVEIRMAATEIAGEDPERVAKLYQRCNLAKCGVIHEWRRSGSA